MSFFNKIKESDSLSKAILRKKGQASISDKTRKKLQEKVNGSADIKVYNNYMSCFKESLGINEEIKSCLRKAFLVKTYAKVIDCLEKNVSPNDSMNLTDEILMDNIVNNLKKKAKYANQNFSYYKSIAKFYEFLSGIKEGSGRGVIHMVRKHHLESAHFCALEYRVIRGRRYVLFMESAKLQGEPDAGPDYGLLALRETAKLYFKDDYPVIAYLEMDVQRSAHDCAIYSIYTATHLQYCVNYIDRIFELIRDENITLFSSGLINTVNMYWRGAERILNPENKYSVSMDVCLLKHGHSVRTLRRVVDELMNAKEKSGNPEFFTGRFNAEKLGAQLDKYSIIRDSDMQKGKKIFISNSIEYKRKKLYEALLSEQL